MTASSGTCQGLLPTGKSQHETLMVLKGQVARGWLGRTTGVSVPLTVSSGWRRQPHLAQGQPAGAHELTEVAPQMKERGARRLTPIMGDGHSPGSAAN